MNKVVVIKTGVNYCAILEEHSAHHFVVNNKAFFAFLANCIRSILCISVRYYGYNCTCLNLEGDSTFDLDLTTIVSYRSFNSNLGVILNRCKAVGSGEIKNCALRDLGTSIGILVGYGNDSSHSSVRNNNLVLALSGVNYCGGVNGVICYETNRVVGVDSLNFKPLKGYLVA